MRVEDLGTHEITNEEIKQAWQKIADCVEAKPFNIKNLKQAFEEFNQLLSKLTIELEMLDLQVLKAKAGDLYISLLQMKDHDGELHPLARQFYQNLIERLHTEEISDQKEEKTEIIASSEAEEISDQKEEKTEIIASSEAEAIYQQFIIEKASTKAAPLDEKQARAEYDRIFDEIIRASREKNEEDLLKKWQELEQLLEKSEAVFFNGEEDPNEVQKIFQAMNDNGYSVNKEIIELYKKCHLLILANPERVVGTQGELFIDVTLTEEDYRRIFEKMVEAKIVPPEQKLELRDEAKELSYKKKLEQIIGELTETTCCRLDVLANDQFTKVFREKMEKAFWEKYQDQYMKSNEALHSMFGINVRQQVKLALKKRERPCKEKLNQALGFYLNTNPEKRLQVIALQSEASSLLSLTSRLLDKQLNYSRDPAKKDIFEKILKQAELEINQWVLKEFSYLLFKHYKPAKDGKPEEINYSALNKALDQLGKDHLMIECSEALHRAWLSNPGLEIPSKNQIRAAINEAAIHQTTATGKDHLSLTIHAESESKHEGTPKSRYADVLRTTATHVTAHSKLNRHNAEADEKLSLPTAQVVLKRSIAVIVDDKKGSMPSITVQKAQRTRRDIRVPNEVSVAASHMNAVNEYVTRIEMRDSELRKPESLDSKAHDGAVIYNLLLSHHGRYQEELLDPGNKQWERINRTISAAHLFNFQKLQESQDPLNFNAFHIVMSIPVNGHGNSISLNQTGLRGEMALMSEIAMIFTLDQNKDALTGDQQRLLSEILTNCKAGYREFLNAKRENFQHHATEHYFVNSTQGRALIVALHNFHRNMKSTMTPEFKVAAGGGTGEAKVEVKEKEQKSLRQLATLALAKIQAEGLYTKLEHGLMIQTISSFLESHSVNGCKSANDRWSMLASGVELLVSMEGRETAKEAKEVGDIDQRYHQKEKELRRSFEAFAEGSGTLSDLQTCLEVAINNLRLHSSAATTVTHEDSGPGKLHAVSASLRKLNLLTIVTSIGGPTFSDIRSLYRACKEKTNTNYGVSSNFSSLWAKRSGSLQKKEKLAEAVSKAFASPRP